MTLTLPLAALRGYAEMALPDTCTVTRPDRVSDGEGGFITSPPPWPTIATVACRVSPLGNAANEIEAGEAVRAIAQYVVHLPAGTDVTSDDRLVVGSRTFQVIEPIRRSYEVIRRVIAREVE